MNNRYYWQKRQSCFKSDHMFFIWISIQIPPIRHEFYKWTVWIYSVMDRVFYTYSVNSIRAAIRLWFFSLYSGDAIYFGLFGGLCSTSFLMDYITRCDPFVDCTYYHHLDLEFLDKEYGDSSWTINRFNYLKGKKIWAHE